MLLLDIPAVTSIIQNTGINAFYLKLIQQLELDFSRWHEFNKSPRHATHYEHGVIELMPCSDSELYSFKYVNGHPYNTLDNKLCVAAIGLLAKVSSGYPLLISEMTLLTALRTAAVSALGVKYLARDNSSRLAIIGTGAQSEFQAMAIKSVLPIDTLYIYDTDKKAMDKFVTNMTSEFHSVKCCDSINSAIQNADIIITATAAKKSVSLFNADEVKPGTHIHAMGGDCPGKTELATDILKTAKLVVEFSEQSLIEGEIQQLNESHIYAELWEIITNKKDGRTNDKEITLFDSVGFAIEDFSILKLIYKLATDMKTGREIDLIPSLANPKDLYSLIKPH